MKYYKVGFIGTGNIATAIYNGITSSGYIKYEDIMVFDADESKFCTFADKGSAIAINACELTEKCEFVFLTVKPQINNSVLTEIKSCASNTCFIDVAAGISILTVKKLLGFDAPVIRVMPNTPLMVGVGATALVKTSPVSDEQFIFIKGCFDSCGITVVVDESDINTVIAASGSSPAYIMKFSKILIDYAINSGLSPSDARNLVIQTLAGCAKLVSESNEDISKLISNVTSPNGTTAAGISALDENGFEECVITCLKATVKRAEELSI